jgi:hypothetical protein
MGTGLGSLRGLLVVRGDYTLLWFHAGVVSHDLSQRLSFVLLSFVQQWRLPLDHNCAPLDLRPLIIALPNGFPKMALTPALLVLGGHHHGVYGSIYGIKDPCRVLGVYQNLLLLILL